MATISVERTGEFHGISGSQFKITYPNDTIAYWWSNPLHTASREEEEAEALLVAVNEWKSQVQARSAAWEQEMEAKLILAREWFCGLSTEEQEAINKILDILSAYEKHLEADEL